MLQPLLQPCLLRRRKLPELRIVFQSAPLLRRRQIFIAPQPISGVPRLILRRAILWRAILRCPTHRRTRWIRVACRGTLLFLKVVPLPVRILRFGMRLSLGSRSSVLAERRRHQQKAGQTAREFYPTPHVSIPSLASANLQITLLRRSRPVVPVSVPSLKI